MTTIQHRPAPRVSFDDVPSWVWIAIAAVLAVAMGVAIGYTVADQGTTEAVTSVDGYEYNSEATPMHMVTETPVTVNYLGNSGVLYPEAIPVAPVLGFEPMLEATSMHLATTDPVTVDYLGHSGELYPAVTVMPAAMGFDYDHEVTPIHVSSSSDWVTAEFVGMSGALSIEH